MREANVIEYFNDVADRRGSTVWTDPSHRPSWMSDSQWEQSVRWQLGRAIPTDAELLSGLRGDSNYNGSDRMHRYVWNTTAASCVDDNFDLWASLIRGRFDPDLNVDEGL